VLEEKNYNVEPNIQNLAMFLNERNPDSRKHPIKYVLAMEQVREGYPYMYSKFLIPGASRIH